MLSPAHPCLDIVEHIATGSAVGNSFFATALGRRLRGHDFRRQGPGCVPTLFSLTAQPDCVAVADDKCGGPPGERQVSRLSSNSTGSK